MPILTAWQRVDLRKLLESNGFSPDEFELRLNVTTGGHDPGEQLKLKDSNYYFSIFFNHSDFQHEKFWIEYSPGTDRLRGYDFSWNWDSVCHDFKEYLLRLRYELQIAAADPWQQPGVRRVVKQTQGQTLIPAGHEFTGQRLARLVFAGATKSLD